jgi:hypothetical protein
MKISRSVKEKKRKNPTQRVQKICLGKNVPKTPYFDPKKKEEEKSQVTIFRQYFLSWT